MRYFLTKPVPFYSSLVTFLVIIGMFAYQHSLGLTWLLAYLCSVNSVIMGVYGYDKLIAWQGWPIWRVPETVLQGLALAGGTPAAVLAQQWFHHKTVKAAFQTRFWLIFTFQAALIVLGFGWWLTI